MARKMSPMTTMMMVRVMVMVMMSWLNGVAVVDVVVVVVCCLLLMDVGGRSLSDNKAYFIGIIRSRHVNEIRK